MSLAKTKLSPHGMAALQPARKQAPAQDWMLTFADLTSLLLCFFVLFYATLIIHQPNWQTLVGSFSATFAPGVAVVTATPADKENALPVVRTYRNVAYLDGLLRQRLQNAAAWRDLRGFESVDGRTFRYVLPAALTDPLNPDARAAWRQMGAVLINWRTPVAVRVVIASNANWGEATARAWALAELARAGGGRVTSEVVRGNLNQTEWILYNAD